MKNHENYKQIKQFVDPCESLLFSFYCNAEGYAFPCSFTEEHEEWKTGINMLEVKDFFADVWYNTRVVAWRNVLISSTNNCNNCRVCPKFKI
jgi:hypothetical protein